MYTDEEKNVAVDMTVLGEVEKARQKVAAKPNYSKDIRKQIDDVSKRKKFKAETFDGAKTIKDPYTNQTIHSNAEAATRKYGSQNLTKHTGDVDHTIPLQKVYEKTQYNPFISIEDDKRIANSDSNYKVINAKTNRSKGGSSNAEYIKKNADTLDDTQKRAMMHEQYKAEININANIAKTTLKNMHGVGVNAAKTAAKFGGSISAASNVCQVIKGEEDIETAVIHTALDTARVSAVSYGTSIGTQIIEGGVNKIVANTASKQLAQGLSTFVQGGGPAKVVVVITQAGDSVMRYIKGEITAVELIDELGEKGSGVVAAMGAGSVGLSVGTGAGALIGGIVGSILPGIGNIVGAEAGAAIGACVGEILGNMVGYMFGTEIYRRVQEFKAKFLVDPCELERMEKIYTLLEQEMIAYRRDLEKSLEQVHLQFKENILHAFVDMQKAIEANDVDKVTMSLEQVCQEFDHEVAFRTRAEFDSFMLDEAAVVRRKGR